MNKNNLSNSEEDQEKLENQNSRLLSSVFRHNLNKKLNIY